MQPDQDRNKQSSARGILSHIWHSPFLAVIILILGLAISFYLATQSAQQTRTRTQDRLQTTAKQTTRVIQEKVDRFELLMMSGRGLILNNQDLSSWALNARWHRMFNSFNIDFAGLGLVGLSFTRYLEAHERNSFLADLNADTKQPLEIFPPPLNNQSSLVVMHLVPHRIESRMIGYDLMSEERRREAGLEAIRSHQPVLSRPLSLLPTDIHSLDYLQLLPVISDTHDRERFLGVVTAGFSVSTLIESSLLNLPIALRIQLIDTRESLQSPSYDTHPKLALPEEALTHTSKLMIGGQTLTLRISSLDPSAGKLLAQQYDAATLISGLSITLLITMTLMFFIIARHQALQLSRRMASRAEEIHHRYRSLFNQSPEAIVVHVDGRVELANLHAARLFGCTTPEDLYQYSVKDLVHPDSLDAVRRRGSALHQGQSLEPAEQKLIRMGGQPFTAEVSSSIINYKGRKAVQVMFRDISAEKRQRLESRIANVVFNHSSDAIMVTDKHGRIELVNRAFQEMTGYTEASVRGRSPDLLNAGQHNSDFFFALWSSLLETGSWSGDIINRTRGGRTYIQETDISSLRDNDQQITHFVCLMRDVTHTRNAFEEIRETALQDPLTRVPNRIHFQTYAEKILRDACSHQLPFLVLLINLDNFKRINQQYPYHVGDQVLSELAQRLSEVFENGMLARYSANEFIIALSGDEAEATDNEVITRVDSVIRTPVQIQDHTIDLTTYYGCARLPLDGSDLYTLIALATKRSREGKV